LDVYRTPRSDTCGPEITKGPLVRAFRDLRAASVTTRRR